MSQFLKNDAKIAASKAARLAKRAEADAKAQALAKAASEKAALQAEILRPKGPEETAVHYVGDPTGSDRAIPGGRRAETPEDPAPARPITDAEIERRISEAIRSGEGIETALARAIQMARARDDSQIVIPAPLTVQDLHERIARILKGAGYAHSRDAMKLAFPHGDPSYRAKIERLEAGESDTDVGLRDPI